MLLVAVYVYARVCVRARVWVCCVLCVHAISVGLSFHIFLCMQHNAYYYLKINKQTFTVSTVYALRLSGCCCHQILKIIPFPSGAGFCLFIGIVCGMVGFMQGAMSSAVPEFLKQPSNFKQGFWVDSCSGFDCNPSNCGSD
jgi:hypothetical protein